MIRSRWMFLGALIAVVVGFPILFFVVTRPSLRVVHTWPKDSSVDYSGAGNLYLTVFETGMDWSSFPFGLNPTYGIYVGRDAHTPEYGHEMPFAFYGNSPVNDQQIAASNVTWTEAGVEFEAPSQHRLFIPKAMFLGGR